MTKEEALLNEARIRYPVGTKFISPQSGRSFTVSSNSYRIVGNDIDVDQVPYLYYNGKWAEIILKPEVKEESKFIVGKWYRNYSWSSFICLKFEKEESGCYYGEKLYGSGNIIYCKKDYINRRDAIEGLEPLRDPSEIQQYLPDGHPDKLPNKQEMKELTELPKKWYMKVDFQEQFMSFIKWGVEKHNMSKIHLETRPMFPYYCAFKGAELCGYNKGKGPYMEYTEITFDQFKERVLKESKKSDVPEYVECIGEFTPSTTKGKIYKVGSHPLSWINNNGTQDAYSTSVVYFENFKPSTKEDYDTQQKDNVVESKDKKWVPKVGDWVVTSSNIDSYGQQCVQVIKVDNTDKGWRINANWKNKDGNAVSLYTYRNTEPNFDMRKALPHEIPVEKEVTVEEPVSKNKTVREWFNTLPSHLRDKAIEYCRTSDYEYNLETECDSLDEALENAFDWEEDTEEGEDFWYGLSKLVTNKEDINAYGLDVMNQITYEEFRPNTWFDHYFIGIDHCFKPIPTEPTTKIRRLGTTTI